MGQLYVNSGIWNVIIGPWNVNRDLQCDYWTVLCDYVTA